MATYIKSTDVSVYPASNRDDSSDRYAKLNIEHNLINIINRLVGVDSFIIEGLSVNESGTAIEAGLCNIHGYLFRLKETSISNIQKATAGYCLGLKIRVGKNADGKEQLINVTAEGITSTSNDVNSMFMGIEWITYKSNDPLGYPADNKDGYKSYVLPIAWCKSGSSKWENILNDDGTQGTRAFTQLFTLKQLEVVSHQAGNSYANKRQDLLTFLENNYIIDDGEVR